MTSLLRNVHVLVPGVQTEEGEETQRCIQV